MADLSHQHHRNLYHARIEHLHLATTVKNRLISRLAATKKKLASDKEHIEFTDTNLNIPVNQIQQPYMSPSRDTGSNGNDNYSSGIGTGAQRRRQLRNRKNGDDILNPDFAPSSKRKRRAAQGSPMLHSSRHKYDDDDDLDCLDSPGDSSQTPLPKPQTYQIDQLFSKQELAISSSLAAIASVRFQTPSNHTKGLIPLTYENAEKELATAQSVVGTRSNHMNLPTAGTTKNQASAGPAPLRPDDSLEDLELIRRAVGDGSGKRGGWGGGGMKRTASGAGFAGGEIHKKRR